MEILLLLCSSGYDIVMRERERERERDIKIWPVGME
jgi:hypothetical protein